MPSVLKNIAICIIVSIFFLCSRTAWAIYDPLSVSNNKYGIHVIDPTDIANVEELVNSSGGSWGYVKVVIPETDRNTEKWDPIFREFRRRKLIPIVRIASKSIEDYWDIPTEQSIADWPAFLNSLSWPTANRYVMLYNEPNHANEWGKTVDPIGFATIATSLSNLLKLSSPDYFILGAGLDVSAPSDLYTMDAQVFLSIIAKEKPEYFHAIDGWTSHSYPNPAFSQPPERTGRISLRSYLWEKSLLQDLGVWRNYPVVIGETGWIHQQGQSFVKDNLQPEKIAEYITNAGETVWKDSSILAVLPFVYNYQTPPFDVFSFRTIGNSAWHPHAFAYKSIPKQTGKPLQHEAYSASSDLLPPTLITRSEYTLAISLTNEGQAIFTPGSGYSLIFRDENGENPIIIKRTSIGTIEPDETREGEIVIQTPDEPGEHTMILEVRTPDEQTLQLGTYRTKILPPPSLVVQVPFGLLGKSKDTQSTVLIYDGDTVLHEFTDLPVLNGVIGTPGLLGIIPDKPYRIVTLIAGYLPVQNIASIGTQITVVPMPKALPLDANLDQQLTLYDVALLLLQNPWEVGFKVLGL